MLVIIATYTFGNMFIAIAILTALIEYYISVITVLAVCTVQSELNNLHI